MLNPRSPPFTARRTSSTSHPFPIPPSAQLPSTSGSETNASPTPSSAAVDSDVDSSMSSCKRPPSSPSSATEKASQRTFPCYITSVVAPGPPTPRLIPHALNVIPPLTRARSPSAPAALVTGPISLHSPTPDIPGSAINHALARLNETVSTGTDAGFTYRPSFGPVGSGRHIQHKTSWPSSWNPGSSGVTTRAPPSQPSQSLILAHRSNQMVRFDPSTLSNDIDIAIDLDPGFQGRNMEVSRNVYINRIPVEMEARIRNQIEGLGPLKVVRSTVERAENADTRILAQLFPGAERPNGFFALVMFYQLHQADAFLNKMLVQGLHGTKAIETTQLYFESLGDPSSSNLYLENIPVGTTEADIHDLFDPLVIASLKFNLDEKGNQRGSGFVRCQSRAMAEEALRRIKRGVELARSNRGATSDVEHMLPQEIHQFRLFSYFRNLEIRIAWTEEQKNFKHSLASDRSADRHQDSYHRPHHVSLETRSTAKPIVRRMLSCPAVDNPPPPSALVAQIARSPPSPYPSRVLVSPADRNVEDMDDDAIRRCQDALQNEIWKLQNELNRRQESSHYKFGHDDDLPMPPLHRNPSLIESDALLTPDGDNSPSWPGAVVNRRTEVGWRLADPRTTSRLHRGGAPSSLSLQAAAFHPAPPTCTTISPATPFSAASSFGQQQAELVARYPRATRESFNPSRLHQGTSPQTQSALSHARSSPNLTHPTHRQ